MLQNKKFTYANVFPYMNPQSSENVQFCVNFENFNGVKIRVMFWKIKNINLCTFCSLLFLKFVLFSIDAKHAG